MLHGPPVGRPFPDIANDIVKSVLVLRERIHWCRTYVSIFFTILKRKFTLPDIHPVKRALTVIEFNISLSRYNKEIDYQCFPEGLALLPQG